MKCQLAAEPMKRTEYFATLCKLVHLSPKNPMPLTEIVELYKKGSLSGSINYYRAILKRRRIVYASIKASIQETLKNTSVPSDKISIYEELYSASLVTDQEILEIFREFSQVHPNEMFSALEDPDSFLLKICRLIRTDFSESVCVISRTMLECNMHMLLEYISKREHSKTLKYLIKDIEGMGYLKENILISLVEGVDTLEGIKDMLNKVITLHISLTKIDFTLVLLTPIMEHIKERLSERLNSCGSDLAAEVLFGIISSRGRELVENVQEIGRDKGKSKVQLQGDVLDFLLSLLPYDSVIHTLALSISRDCILYRSDRNELIRILEGKLGFYRASSIGIIKRDFEYFCGIKVSEADVFEDVLKGTCIPREVFQGGTLGIENFIVSEHYWPENNYQSWDDLLGGAGAWGDKQGVKNNLNEQISLEYSDKHTYLDVSVEVGGKVVDLSVPIRYVEYLYSQDMPQDEINIIKEFWAHVMQA
ncbi:hypothetical protein NEAUS03_1657 [Nematocida ausubeli]|nr:hypothetical protein NEAUS03_1657 [Nematocida ausubeli]